MGVEVVPALPRKPDRATGSAITEAPHSMDTAATARRSTGERVAAIVSRMLQYYLGCDVGLFQDFICRPSCS